MEQVSVRARAHAAAHPLRARGRARPCKSNESNIRLDKKCRAAVRALWPRRSHLGTLNGTNVSPCPRARRARARTLRACGIYTYVNLLYQYHLTGVAIE